MTTETRSRGALHVLLARPYLLLAIAFGVALYFGLTPWIMRPMTRALIGWNAGVILFTSLMFFLFMRNMDVTAMKARALEHDEGGHLILLIAILAAVASVGALVAELQDAKNHAYTGLHVLLA